MECCYGTVGIIVRGWKDRQGIIANKKLQQLPDNQQGLWFLENYIWNTHIAMVLNIATTIQKITMKIEMAWGHFSDGAVMCWLHAVSSVAAWPRQPSPSISNSVLYDYVQCWCACNHLVKSSCIAIGIGAWEKRFNERSLAIGAWVWTCAGATQREKWRKQERDWKSDGEEWRDFKRAIIYIFCF